MPKFMSTSIAQVRKDCKLRIPFVIIRDVERLIFADGIYKYFNDFAIDAILEKLKRTSNKKDKDNAKRNLSAKKLKA